MNQTYIKKIGLATLAVLLTGGALFAQNLKVAPGRQSIVPYRNPDSTDAPPFFSNLVVDPCTSCNYDSVSGGYYVWGTNNCEASAVNQWIAIPFVAAKNGVPKMLEASVVLDVCNTTATKFTLSVFTDSCAGPGTLVAGDTGVATAPAAPCALAVARIRAGTALVQGTTYWLCATTTSPSQDSFSGIWYASNPARIGYVVGATTPWAFFSGLVPAGAVL
jgi:hypothetical protein